MRRDTAAPRSIWRVWEDSKMNKERRLFRRGPLHRLQGNTGVRRRYGKSRGSRADARNKVPRKGVAIANFLREGWPRYISFPAEAARPIQAPPP